MAPDSVLADKVEREASVTANVHESAVERLSPNDHVDVFARTVCLAQTFPDLESY